MRDIRKLYSIHDILRASRDVIPCPMPQHKSTGYRTPSFSIFRHPKGHDWFKCHGNCGLKGDVIDLIGFMEVPGYQPNDPEMVKRAITHLSGHSFSEPKPVPPRAFLSTDSLAGLTPLTEDAISYMKQRGINKETMDHFGLRMRGTAIAIPVFEFGELKAVKTRDIYKKKYRAIKGSTIALFNVDDVAFLREPIYIVKGEIAAMAMWQHGFKVCAPTGGEGATKAEWMVYLEMSKKRIVVGDNDPGNVGVETKRLARQRAKTLEAELRFPPEEYKDIDEWILNDPDAVKEIKQWSSTSCRPR